MRKTLRPYEVCGRARWNNYSSDAFSTRANLHVFNTFLDCEITASFHPIPILISHASAYILAKLSIETLYTSGFSSCIVERMAVHDTIGTPEFLYVPCSWDRRSTLARNSAEAENRWGIKRMSRFRKQFLRNISCLVKEDKTAVSEIRNSERWTFSLFTLFYVQRDAATNL